MVDVIAADKKCEAEVKCGDSPPATSETGASSREASPNPGAEDVSRSKASRRVVPPPCKDAVLVYVTSMQHV